MRNGEWNGEVGECGGEENCSTKWEQEKGTMLNTHPVKSHRVLFPYYSFLHCCTLRERQRESVQLGQSLSTDNEFESAGISPDCQEVILLWPLWAAGLKHIYRPALYAWTKSVCVCVGLSKGSQRVKQCCKADYDHERQTQTYTQLKQ